MLVAEQKPLEEIMNMIVPYEKIMILGCGTCMTVCGAGGEREVSFLHSALSLADNRKQERPHIFYEYTLKRQCDFEFMEIIADKILEIDAVLSLGCGVGVQAVAERFPGTVALPGVNTFFLGMASQWGVWDEKCSACGDCRLDTTGGICPITRCAKGLLNGPCSGNKNGKCEVNKDTDCAWVLIYKSLQQLGQLDKIKEYYPPRNFRPLARPQKIISLTEEIGGKCRG